MEPEEGSLPLLSGIAIHAAHARLLAGEQLQPVLDDVLSAYRAEIAERGILNLDITQDIIKEQSALLEGMLRLWSMVRLPRILEEYEVESIEERHDWELAPGLVQRMRKDALLRRRDDGLRFILDYKTVKYPSEVWFEKFEHNLQTCHYILSEKERTGEPIGGILYEGLVKGAFRKDTAFKSPWYGQKIQQSPYTIAYRYSDENMTLYQSEYTNKKGYQKVKTFEQMPMKDWIERFLIKDERTVQELFITVPEICPPDYELQRVKQQTIREELQYQKQLAQLRELDPESRQAEEYLDLIAPLRTNHCYKYGEEHKCPFLSVCFNQGARPLEDGGFRRRTPHHDTDLKMVA